MKRCDWCGNDPIYISYHDKEWGKPVHSDKKLFEFLILEGAQAGLSWITILKKRHHYRQALDNFNFTKIAKYSDKKIESLMKNPGLVRNRLKLNSIVTNAKAFNDIRDEFGTFNKYIWSYVNYQPLQNKWRTVDAVPAKTPLSDEISMDLKKRGFKFMGSTICYAFMQATGMVNDHIMSCHRYQDLS